MKKLKENWEITSAVLICFVVFWASFQEITATKGQLTQSNHGNGAKHKNILYTNDSIYVVSTVLDSVLPKHDREFKLEKMLALGGR